MPSLARRAAALALTALVIYGVAPAIGEVLGAFDEVITLKPWWLVAMVLAEAASCWCLWELQALSIGTRDTVGVATSQLAGGALGRVIPGGAATAAATQYNMLNTSDVPRASIATGLAAATVLQIAGLCVLPVLALPAIVFGLRVPETLFETGALGLGLFVAMLGVGLAAARSERILRWVGRLRGPRQSSGCRATARCRRHCPIASSSSATRSPSASVTAYSSPAARRSGAGSSICWRS